MIYRTLEIFPVLPKQKELVENANNEISQQKPTEAAEKTAPIIVLHSKISSKRKTRA